MIEYPSLARGSFCGQFVWNILSKGPIFLSHCSGGCDNYLSHSTRSMTTRPIFSPSRTASGLWVLEDMFGLGTPRFNNAEAARAIGAVWPAVAKLPCSSEQARAKEDEQFLDKHVQLVSGTSLPNQERTLGWRGRSVGADARLARTLHSSGRSVGADTSTPTERPQGWGTLKTRGRAWTLRITLHHLLVWFDSLSGSVASVCIFFCVHVLACVCICLCAYACPCVRNSKKNGENC